ncbi:MAG TPA: AraC family transcriptional regulator [Thermoanaerobaculia bacterium]|nr:AraC family transcriptional regulator [Thermoanaerobaculia bacterium]
MSAVEPIQEAVFDDSDWVIPGIEIDCLYKSPSLAITTWNCRCGQTGLSGEKVEAEYVISFVHEGVFVLHSEGRSEVIDRTTVVLFNPDAPFRSSHPFGCSDHGSTIVVRRDVLLDVMSHYDPAAQERPAALFPTPFGPDLSQTYVRHRLIVQGLSQGVAPDPLALETSVLEILGSIARSCRPPGAKRRGAAPESSRARRRYVYDAQLLLQERFRERYRLEEIARELYVSPFHLCRLFKQETGMPMHRYVNRLRLREAMEQLTEGADLTELALSLGFAGHSHFTTAFRKEFGVPPSEVRRQASAPRIAEMKKALS